MCMRIKFWGPAAVTVRIRAMAVTSFLVIYTLTHTWAQSNGSILESALEYLLNTFYGIQTEAKYYT